VTERQETLKRTPLYDLHVRDGGRIVPFAGYEMPVQYKLGVVGEHQAVRTAVGLFDVSHMGEVELTGARALEAANRIITNDLTKAADGQALYTAMLKPDGGIVDDLVVYRFSPERIFICVNASNRAKDFAWIHRECSPLCTVVDRSDEFAQIAVQGPRGAELVQRLTSTPLAPVGTYRFTTGQVAGIDTIISRTGYTGEDGFELYVPAARGPELWQALMEKGADLGIKPAGLGARDSLRLEMKYALYGNDIDETTNPLEAGLGWIVKLDKADFIGKSALEAIKAKGLTRKLVGFEMVGRGVARHGYPLLDSSGAVIGTCTSGSPGPTVGKNIGLGYVPSSLAAIGTELVVDCRGRKAEAVVVKTPFYKRPAR
jgi:aminomethyltransferase